MPTIFESEPAGPTHKRTKRLLRATVTTKGPQRVHEMKFKKNNVFFLFFFVIYYTMSMFTNSMNDKFQKSIWGAPAAQIKFCIGLHKGLGRLRFESRYPFKLSTC